MLAWMMDNKEWLFSGIGVVLLTSIIGWFFSKRGNRESNIGSKNSAGRDQTITIDNSVQQTHSGSGDNVGRDKHVKE